MRGRLKNRVAWIALAAAATLVGGCSINQARADIPYDSKTFSAPDTPFALTGQEQVRIGPQDVVRILVFEVPEVSGDFEVSALGNLDLPLVGAVPAQNMTTDELAKSLETVLKRKYLQDPRVTVAVKEARSQRVTIDGSINAPGIYPVAGNTTLLKAVALAKGLDENANPNRVVVFRTIEGRRAAAAFDLTKVREGITPDPVIYGNDVIVVDGSRTRSALRDVIRTLPLISLFRFF